MTRKHEDHSATGYVVPAITDPVRCQSDLPGDYIPPPAKVRAWLRKLAPEPTEPNDDIPEEQQ